MSTLITFHHTGHMPCPLCGIEPPHVHSDVALEDAVAAARAAHRGARLEPQPLAMSAMAAAVLAERQRQIDVEGFTPERDVAAYPRGELVKAALCYTLYAVFGSAGRSLPPDAAAEVRRFWPWDWTWWKPVERRRAMVKAAALLIAEGDRLDAAAAQAADDLERS